MKALVFHGTGEKKWEEVPDPTVQAPTDCIVKVDTSTICGTDLHILKGDVPTVEEGRVLGHEAVGHVVEVGSGVRAFAVGDRVLISCITTCGSCNYCRAKLGSHCSTVGGIGWIFGHLIDGTQAEYVRVPLADTSMHALPDGISDEQAVFLSDAIPTGYEIGIHDGRTVPGDTVAIVGAGAVGLAAVLTANLHGASRVIAIDSNEFRLQKALEFGATDVLGPGDQVAEEVKELTDGEGVDVAIEAVGYPETLRTTASLVRPGGRIANVGVHGTPVELPMDEMWIQNVSISMGLVSTWSTPMLLKLVASGRLPSEKMGTHEFKLDNITDAYDTFGNAAQENCLRTVIKA